MQSIDLINTQLFGNEINWSILIPFLVLAIVLIANLIYRNRKDQNKYEEEANNDFVSSPEREEIENGEM